MAIHDAKRMIVDAEFKQKTTLVADNIHDAQCNRTVPDASHIRMIVFSNKNNKEHFPHINEPNLDKVFSNMGSKPCHLNFFFVPHAFLSTPNYYVVAAWLRHKKFKIYFLMGSSHVKGSRVDV